MGFLFCLTNVHLVEIKSISLLKLIIQQNILKIEAFLIVFLYLPERASRDPKERCAFLQKGN